MNCAFCTLDELKERTIAENNLALAFPTYTPVVPGHALIIPKRHVGTYDELTTEEWLAIEDLRSTLRIGMQKLYGAGGFNYAWNEGEVAGQSVPHLHLHILPRKEGDTGVHGYEPRGLFYWTPTRTKLSPGELVQVSQEIRASLAT